MANPRRDGMGEKPYSGLYRTVITPRLRFASGSTGPDASPAVPLPLEDVVSHGGRNVGGTSTANRQHSDPATGDGE